MAHCALATVPSKCRLSPGVRTTRWPGKPVIVISYQPVILIPKSKRYEEPTCIDISDYFTLVCRGCYLCDRYCSDSIHNLEKWFRWIGHLTTRISGHRRANGEHHPSVGKYPNIRQVSLPQLGWTIGTKRAENAAYLIVFLIVVRGRGGRVCHVLPSAPIVHCHRHRLIFIL